MLEAIVKMSLVDNTMKVSFHRIISIFLGSRMTEHNDVMIVKSKKEEDVKMYRMGEEHKS
jgi:hypothetical protein